MPIFNTTESDNGQWQLDVIGNIDEYGSICDKPLYSLSYSYKASTILHRGSDIIDIYDGDDEGLKKEAEDILKYFQKELRKNKSLLSDMESAASGINFHIQEIESQSSNTVKLIKHNEKILEGLLDNHKQGLLSLADAALSRLDEQKKENEYLKTSMQDALELSKELSSTLVDGERIVNFIIERVNSLRSDIVDVSLEDKSEFQNLLAESAFFIKITEVFSSLKEKAEDLLESDDIDSALEKQLTELFNLNEDDKEDENDDSSLTSLILAKMIDIEKLKEVLHRLNLYLNREIRKVWINLEEIETNNDQALTYKKRIESLKLEDEINWPEEELGVFNSASNKIKEAKKRLKALKLEKSILQEELTENNDKIEKTAKEVSKQKRGIQFIQKFMENIAEGVYHDIDIVKPRITAKQEESALVSPESILPIIIDYENEFTKYDERISELRPILKKEISNEFIEALKGLDGQLSVIREVLETCWQQYYKRLVQNKDQDFTSKREIVFEAFDFLSEKLDPLLREVEVLPIFKSFISLRLKSELRTVTTNYSLKSILAIHEQVLDQLRIAISKLPLEEELILDHSVSELVTDSALEPILPITVSNRPISYLIEEEVLTNESSGIEELFVEPIIIAPSIKTELAAIEAPIEEIMEEVREEIEEIVVPETLSFEVGPIEVMPVTKQVFDAPEPQVEEVVEYLEVEPIIVIPRIKAKLEVVEVPAEEITEYFEVEPVKVMPRAKLAAIEAPIEEMMEEEVREEALELVVAKVLEEEAKPLLTEIQEIYLQVQDPLEFAIIEDIAVEPLHIVEGAQENNLQAKEIAEQVITEVYEELLQQDVSVQSVMELPIEEQLKEIVAAVEMGFPAVAILEEELNEVLQLEIRDPKQLEEVLQEVMPEAPLELSQTAIHIENYEEQEVHQEKIQIDLSDAQNKIEEIMPPVQEATLQTVTEDHQQVIENHYQLKKVIEETNDFDVTLDIKANKEIGSNFSFISLVAKSLGISTKQQINQNYEERINVFALAPSKTTEIEEEPSSGYQIKAGFKGIIEQFIATDTNHFIADEAVSYNMGSDYFDIKEYSFDNRKRYFFAVGLLGNTY